MLEQILELDTQLFLLLNNGGFDAPWLDSLMLWWRDKESWIPFYVVLAALLAYRFKWKALPLIILAVVSVSLADQLSSNLIKPLVGRLRPCQEADLQDQMRLLLRCGGGKSFTSSHAANHMALALFLSFPLFRTFKIWCSGLILWAIIVAFAQIYVGLHYPLDILGGFIAGSLCAVLSYLILLKISPYWRDRTS